MIELTWSPRKISATIAMIPISARMRAYSARSLTVLIAPQEREQVRDHSHEDLHCPGGANEFE